MPRFIDKWVKDFLNIYLDEKNIRDAYDDEYADRFSAVHPVTGKRKISASKVLTRIFIVFMIIFMLIIIVRMATINL